MTYANISISNEEGNHTSKIRACMILGYKGTDTALGLVWIGIGSLINHNGEADNS